MHLSKSRRLVLLGRPDRLDLPDRPETSAHPARWGRLVAPALPALLARSVRLVGPALPARWVRLVDPVALAFPVRPVGLVHQVCLEPLAFQGR
ncbi:hypothetical protein [Mycobacterium talmoniae]|uniref:Uncharacterized protein n=1 Tax=Mycobacterium talmoniae TaxID=1858794 RepID=A0A1S1NNC3_9MYCO|nr:hypothetical protein [Mycobacterium talmoniae]OHV04256.1 hypothetical protein BKN37_10755 [Mycobacterium talmoniae]